jgi:hypothetical protein
MQARWLRSPTGRRLLAAALASFMVPWAIGEAAKMQYQAGLVDDPVRSQMLIDFIVIGGIVVSLTMVLTYGIGCWVTAVMQGPRHDGDAFPADAAAALHDD